MVTQQVKLPPRKVASHIPVGLSVAPLAISLLIMHWVEEDDSHDWALAAPWETSWGIPASA